MGDLANMLFSLTHPILSPNLPFSPLILVADSLTLTQSLEQEMIGASESARQSSLSLLFSLLQTRALLPTRCCFDGCHSLPKSYLINSYEQREEPVFRKQSQKSESEIRH